MRATLKHVSTSPHSSAQVSLECSVGSLCCFVSPASPSSPLPPLPPPPPPSLPPLPVGRCLTESWRMTSQEAGLPRCMPQARMLWWGLP
uniref:Uncharacterized protein n=1 Tax=Knipowitschia caucasica TaxID=637954 RepID=A0AAV2JIX4_KNICA